MSIQLRQNETIQKEAHFHWTMYLVPGAWAGLLSLSAVGQLIMLFGEKPEASVSGLVWTALIGGGPIFIAWLKGKNKVYVVTNQRLYIEEGILSKSKKDIPLNKINDIFFTQGIFQRMFGSGNVAVMTGNDKPTKIANLDCPEQFRESISQACNYKVA